MYNAIIHKTICKTNQQAGKKTVCGHVKRRKNYAPSGTEKRVSCYNGQYRSFLQIVFVQHLLNKIFLYFFLMRSVKKHLRKKHSWIHPSVHKEMGREITGDCKR